MGGATTRDVSGVRRVWRPGRARPESVNRPRLEASLKEDNQGVTEAFVPSLLDDLASWIASR